MSQAAKPVNVGALTVALMLATLMNTLDSTIANVALPHIQGSVSAAQDQITWVLTSYIIATAIMTPLSGWLSQKIGRKRMFMFSIAGFTAASVLCGTATSLPEIVIYRLLQGIAGASMMPLSQAVMLDLYPQRLIPRVMSLWSAAVILGPIAGPTLGGWLTESLNWRWVFYINVPFGILAFLGVLAFMPKGSRRESRFDFIGFALLGIAVAALQLMLDRGPLLDWFSSNEIRIYATLTGLGLYLFIVHCMTSAEPFIHPSLFRDRNYVTGNVFAFIIGVVVFATLALVPTMLQTLLDRPAYNAGWLTAPRSIGSFAAMLIVGRVVGRVDPRVLIGLGFSLTALSLWQMTWISLQMDGHIVVWSGIIQGFGVGIIWVPMATMAFATLPPAFLNEGTALLSLIRNIGSSIGISAVQALLTTNTQIMHASLVEKVMPYNLAARDPQLAASLATHAGAMALNGEITRQAAMIAYINDFKVMTIVTICALPLLLVLRIKSRRPAEDTPHLAIE